MHRHLLIGIYIILIKGTTFAQDAGMSKSTHLEAIEHPVEALPLSSEVDLETAVLFSLHNNPNIKISSANVALRAGQLQSTGGEFDWTPYTSVEYNHTEAPVLTIASPIDTLISETVEYSTGVRKKFRNGITVTPSVSAEIEKNEAVSSTQAATSLLNLEVVIPLLRGSGTTSANAIEKALDQDLQAAQLAYQQVLSDQTLATINAYWNCAASRARIDILSDIEARAQNLVDTTNSMVSAKILSASVLPQAKANLNDQRALFLAAKIDYTSDLFAFALTLGMKAEDFERIPQAKMQEYTSKETPSIKNSDLIRLTNTNRADINSIRRSLEGRDILVDGAKRDLLPRLDLTLSGGYTGGNSDTDPIRVLGDNLRGANFGVAVNMDFPFGNNYQRGRVTQQEAQYYQIEQELIRLKQRVTASAMESLEVVKLASKRLELIKDTESQYQEAVSIATERFSLGEVTAFELIDMEGRYARSTIDSITALRDYYIAVARLRYETGTLFKDLGTQGSFTLNKLDNPNILTNIN